MVGATFGVYDVSALSSHALNKKSSVGALAFRFYRCFSTLTSCFELEKAGESAPFRGLPTTLISLAVVGAYLGFTALESFIIDFNLFKKVLTNEKISFIINIMNKKFIIVIIGGTHKCQEH